MEHDPLLRVEHLCQYFGENKAVEDVSFSVEKGEVFGLVGESGCGKSTTGRCIVKIYPITSGNIYFEGRRICAGTKSYRDELPALRGQLRKLRKKAGTEAEIAAKRRRMAELRQEIRLAYRDQRQRGNGDIQMIFQDPMASLNPRMTVKEIISEGLVIQGVKDPVVLNQKVYEILETVGLLREHAGRYPHEFSGGQRQRIGIARAIIMNPKLLIADEPISALDVSIQAQVINLLEDLRQKLGLTILFIAHDLSVVKFFSDRIGVMYFGRLVELAASEELFRHPLHPYTKALLSAIPLPDPIAERQRKRMIYDPEPEADAAFQEVCPGHWVLCSPVQAQQYRQELENP